MSSRDYSQCLTEIQLGYASCIQASRSCFQCAMMAHIFFTKIGSYALLVGGAHMISLAIQSSINIHSEVQHLFAPLHPLHDYPLYPLQDVQLLMHTSTPTLIDLEISDFWLHVCTMWLMRLFPSSSAIPSSWRSFLVSTVSSHTLLFSISTVDDDFDELAPMVIIDDAIFFVSGREVSQPNSTDQPSPPSMQRLEKPQRLCNRRPSPRSLTRPTRAWGERAGELLVCLR